MDEWAWRTLLAVSAVGLVAAFWLDWRAWSRYRSDEAPAYAPTLNPRYWRPAKRSWYRDARGYRNNVIARWLFLVTGIAAIVAFVMLGKT